MSNDDQQLGSNAQTPKARPKVRLTNDSQDGGSVTSPPTAEQGTASTSNPEEPSQEIQQIPSWLQKGEVAPLPPADDLADGANISPLTSDSETSTSEDETPPYGQDLDMAQGETIVEGEGGLSEEESQGDVDGESLVLEPHQPTVVTDYAPPPPAAPLQEQAAQIMNDWANRWNVADDPYVVGLGGAFARRDNMTMWATVDPMELLPEPEVISGRLIGRIARALTVVRNVLVFVPVALTWLSIQHATNAFGRFLQLPENSDQKISFLQFWQNPKGLLGDSWRIQNVAKVDATLILLIVFATLLANVLESRQRSVRSSVGKSVDRERTFVALKIAEALQGSKSASPESITESLAFALNDLSQAARDVSLAAARMEVASVGIESLTPRVEDLNRQVSDLNERFGRDVVGSVDSLVSSVSTLGVTLGGDMQKFLSDVLVGLEEINERFNKTSVAVEFGTKQLRDDLDAIHQRLSQVAGGRR